MYKKKNIIVGRWNNIEINLNNKIIAKYDKIRDWKMDPKGYFLIDIDREKKILKVLYCKIKSSKHEAKAEIIGKTAIEVLNTLISYKFISTLQHAGDMGIELNKAEIALKFNLKYVQDKDLKK